MKNINNLSKVIHLNFLSLLLNSKLYIFLLQFTMCQKLKKNITRWFNEINTLTVAERVNHIISNKYEEGIFRIWFSISNIFVFFKSRFNNKCNYLIKRDEKNQYLKSRIVLSIAFNEVNTFYQFDFSKLFFKHLLTRFIFFIFKVFLYTFFLFAIIFNIWTRVIFIIMVILVLCKALHKFDIVLNFKNTLYITMILLLIIHSTTNFNLFHGIKIKTRM